MPGSDIDIGDLTFTGTFVDWAAAIVAAIEAIVEDIEPRIDSGALDITSALSFGGAPAINVGGVRLVGGVSSVVGTLYMDEDNELHIVTDEADVRLTNAGAIDVAALGTIGGDYGGVNPATVTYVDLSGEYRFLEDTGIWATLVAGDLLLQGDNGTVRIGVDDAISGDKTFNVKSLPASGVGGLAYEAASGGVVDATVTRETGTHLFTAINCSGDITLSGSATLKHGDQYFGQTADGGVLVGGGAWVGSVSSNVSFHQLGSAGTVLIPIGRMLKAGDRLKSIRIRGDSTQNPTFTIYSKQGAVVTARAHSATNTIASNGETTLTLSTPYTLATSAGYTDCIELKVALGVGDDFEIYHITGVYDRP